MIDILMATYKGEHYIGEQIDSIISQTNTDWHLYIRDDGSPDNTVMVIKDYVDRYPEKITFIEDGKKGLGAKLNFAEVMKYSKSEYCMFADQDDFWMNDKIEKSYKKIVDLEEKYGKDIPILVHTDLKVVDGNLNILNDSFLNFQSIDPNRNKLKDLLLSNTVTGCTMMLNKSLVKLSGDIPKGCVMHDWWITMIASTFGKIYTINEPTMLYRQHGNNTFGASEYSKSMSLSRISEKIKNNKYKTWIKNTMNSTILQVEDFLSIFRSKLKIEDVELLEDFISINSISSISRKKLILKRKFLFGNTKQDILLLVFA